MCCLTRAVLSRAQTWIMMLGYVHKDRKLSHFQVYKYNVSDAEIESGIAEWTSAKLSYEDDKILVTKTNMFHRAYAYYLNNHAGVDMSFVEIMTRMLNTKKYMVVATMLATGQPLYKYSCEALWKLAIGKTLYSGEVEDLLFVRRSASTRFGVPEQGERRLFVM